MKPWLATALLLLLAVPFQTYWQDYELARRGALAVLAGLLCLLPGALPRQVPAAVWPFSALALWYLVRSLGVINPAYGLETAVHVLALVCLLWVGTGLRPTAVLQAAAITGSVVGAWTVAQGLGFLLPLPGVRVPTATLGNLNVASEVLAVCGAGAALLVSTAPATGARRWPGLLGLGLCAVAVVWNGSLSGLIALPLGCAAACLAPGRGPVLAAAGVGLAVGFLVPPDRGPAPTTAAEPPAAAASPSTTTVRLALWEGCLAMVADRPLVGHGSNQFQIGYPPYRTETELTLSTHDRRFLAEPGTAHNDYLQVSVETGLVGLLLCGIAGFVVLRRAGPAHWAPLLAFAFLAGVRAPLLNAPAAALAFLYAGALLRRGHPPGARELAFGRGSRLFKAIGLGALLLWIGGTQLLSQSALAGMVERLAAGNTDPAGQLRAVERALTYRPHDHNARVLRAQAGLQTGALQQARADLEFLERTRPHDLLGRRLFVQLLRREGRPTAALEALNRLRADHPHDAQLTLWTAEILVDIGQAEAAVRILYENDHLPLRDRLAALLGQLADRAGAQRQPAAVALLRAEQAFVGILDDLARYRANRDQRSAAQRLGDLRGLTRRVQEFGQRSAQVPAARTDLRFLVLLAVVSLEQGDRDGATAVAAMEPQRTLASHHRKPLRAVLAQLRTLPAWRERLGGD